MKELEMKKLFKDGLETFKVSVCSNFEAAHSNKQENAQVYRDAYYAYLGLVSGSNVPCEDYVYPIIRKRVNGTQSILEQTFLEGKDSVIMRPDKGKVSQPVVNAVNTKLNEIIMKENDGYNAFSKAYTDALVFGSSFIKNYLEEDYVRVEAKIGEPMPFSQAVLVTEDGKVLSLQEALKSYPDTDVSTLTVEEGVDGEEATVVGSVTLTTVIRSIGLDYVPFEELFVDPHANTHDVKDLHYLCHRMTKTRGEVLELFAFDKKGKEQDEMVELINSFSGISSAIDYPLSMRKINSNHAMTDDSFPVTEPEAENDRIHLLEHYLYSSNLYTGKERKSIKKERKLYQVFTGESAKEVLSIKEVGFIPFAHGVAMKLNTSFIGRSYYDLFAQDQKLMTYLYSAIKENTDAAAFQRYTAVKGTYDRKALLDNRPGGVVEVTSVGAIDPFPYHQLPPSTESLIQKLEASSLDDEQRAVGRDLMDKASSNASATTTMLSTQNAEMGPKQLCRTMGETLHKQVMRNVYKLIRSESLEIEVEAEISPEAMKMLESFGKQVPATMTIPGNTLPPVAAFTVDVNTANDEARQSGQLMNVIQMVSQMKPGLVTDQNLYNTASYVLDASGVTGVEQYLSDPSKKPAPTPEQQEAMKQKMELEEKQNNLMAGLMDAEYEVKIAQSVESIKKSESFDEQFQHNLSMDEHRIAIEYQKVKDDAAKDEADVKIDLLEIESANRKYDAENQDVDVTVMKKPGE